MQWWPICAVMNRKCAVMNWKICSDEFLHLSVWNTPNTTDPYVFRIKTNEYKQSKRIKWDNRIKLRVERVCVCHLGTPKKKQWVALRIMLSTVTYFHLQNRNWAFLHGMAQKNDPMALPPSNGLLCFVWNTIHHNNWIEYHFYLHFIYE